MRKFRGLNFLIWSEFVHKRETIVYVFILRMNCGDYAIEWYTIIYISPLLYIYIHNIILLNKNELLMWIWLHAKWQWMISFLGAHKNGVIIYLVWMFLYFIWQRGNFFLIPKADLWFDSISKMHSSNATHYLSFGCQCTSIAELYKSPIRAHNLWNQYIIFSTTIASRLCNLCEITHRCISLYIILC